MEKQVYHTLQKKIKYTNTTLRTNKRLQIALTIIFCIFIGVTVYVAQQIQEFRSRAKVTNNIDLFTVTDRGGNPMKHEGAVWHVDTPDVQLTFNAIAAKPLPKVTDVSIYCGPTSNKDVMVGIDVAWNPTSGAVGYLVHINGDTKESGEDAQYIQEAEYEKTYTVSVQNVNQAGLSSEDSESASTTCPSSPEKEDRSNIGASRLIIWPE